MNLDERVAYIKGTPIRNNTQMPNRLVSNPIDKDWDKNIQKMFWYHSTPVEAFSQPELYELRNHLLTLGGSEVCMPWKDPDVKQIIERGQLWYGDRLRMTSGEPCQCHANSAYHWHRNPDKLVLCTGYALSEDGMWRQHSWCVEPRVRKSRIVETTVERIAYFGFAMTEEEADDFYEQNY